MRTLYAKIAVTMLAALLVSLWAFEAISERLERTFIDPVFERMDQLQLESAQTAWDEGAATAVVRYMDHLNHMWGPSHYLLNSSGIDVVSGANLAGFLPRPPATLSRGFVGGRFVVTHRSADGRNWFLSVGPRQQTGSWEFAPYYFLAIGVAALLCGLAAFGVVLPIRTITGTLEKFGRGDLSARSRFRRRDEIGELAQSFNGMAEHLEGLVVSKKRLLEDISHELRSPLARLTLAVRLARTSAEPRAALDRIEREVKRITSLTSEIVEMTRMDGDAQILKPESVNLNELLREAIHDCAGEVEPRPCDIRIDEQFRAIIFADRELLLRAVENILRNAIRYSPDLAPIDIAVARNHSDVLISIRDYGAGVPVESLSLIFDPFFRVNTARDAGTGGVGLGLSIAKRAVLLHRGTVTAHNVNPGLRVEIRLPYQ